MGRILHNYDKIRVMHNNGRILFYNPADGKGIIITPQKEKLDFHVESWDEFDIMPQVGLDVEYHLQGDDIVILKPLKETPARSFSENLSAAASSNDAKATDAEDGENSLALWQKGRSKIDTIRLSIPVNICVEQYFKQIDENINKRTGYKDAKHRLDYLRMRRFLFTMYNNLTELDMHFITPRIKMMRDDLLQMSSVYDDFRSKATYPEIAFEKVFLSRQEEYQKVKEQAELAHSEHSRLAGAEERLSGILEEKEEVLERTLRLSPSFERLNDEHKELKSDYVDTVHMMATLDEAYRHDMEIMMAFEQLHKDRFFELFKVASEKYRKQIVHILDAQAFMFDEQLWLQAQKSKVIQRFFEESHIDGDYCSKTFLKYYLHSLDPEKISAEQRELFKLYDYLDSITRDVVVVVVSDMDAAFHYKAQFAKIAMAIEYQVFIDIQKAFSWLQKHRVSLLLVQEQLERISAESFVKQFGEKIGSRAKCVMISTTHKNAPEGFEGVMKEPLSASAFKEQITHFLKDTHG